MRILAGEFAQGDTAVVGYRDGEYTFEKKAAGKQAHQAKESPPTLGSTPRTEKTYVLFLELKPAHVGITDP